MTIKPFEANTVKLAKNAAITNSNISEIKWICDTCRYKAIHIYVIGKSDVMFIAILLRENV